MRSLEQLRDGLVDDTKDLRLNLANVLQNGSLTAGQRYGVALTSALFLRAEELAAAIAEEGREHLSPEAIADARAAAALMAMNTVYYRTRHMLGKEGYEKRGANLRMMRMGRPASSKLEFELDSMACAALAGCEVCIRSHEASLIKEGASEEQVHDVLRIAAVVNGFQVACEASEAV